MPPKKGSKKVVVPAHRKTEFARGKAPKGGVGGPKVDIPANRKKGLASKGA